MDRNASATSRMLQGLQLDCFVCSAEAACPFGAETNCPGRSVLPGDISLLFSASAWLISFPDGWKTQTINVLIKFYMVLIVERKKQRDRSINKYFV